MTASLRGPVKNYLADLFRYGGKEVKGKRASNAICWIKHLNQVLHVKVHFQFWLTVVNIDQCCYCCCLLWFILVWNQSRPIVLREGGQGRGRIGKGQRPKFTRNGIVWEINFQIVSVLKLTKVVLIHLTHLTCAVIARDNDEGKQVGAAIVWLRILTSVPSPWKSDLDLFDLECTIDWFIRNCCLQMTMSRKCRKWASSQDHMNLLPSRTCHCHYFHCLHIVTTITAFTNHEKPSAGIT